MTTATNILVVEDDPMVRSLLARHFRKQGFTVAEAGDVAGALALYRAGPDGIDVIVTDVHLPDGSGLDLALAAREAREDQPIVFVTGDVDAELAQRALAHDGAGYLLKPFEFFELDAAVRQTLAAAQARPPAPPVPAARAATEEWRTQQQRLLEASAKQPVAIGLRLVHSKPERRSFPLALRIALILIVFALIAWGVGYLLGADPPSPTAPAPTAGPGRERTIYVPYEAPEPARPRETDRPR